MPPTTRSATRVETAQWMASEGFHSLRLVTASYHMPRSLLEFSRAMPDIGIMPNPVFPERLKQAAAGGARPARRAADRRRIHKYLVALARPAVPRTLLRRRPAIDPSALAGLQALFYLWTTLCAVLGLPFMLLPRLWMMRFGTEWSRATCCGCSELSVGLDHEIRGREHLPRGPALIAMKHQSAWDTFAVPVLFPIPAMVIKRELGWVPVLWLVRAQGRHDRASTAAAAARRCCAWSRRRSRPWRSSARS